MNANIVNMIRDNIMLDSCGETRIAAIKAAIIKTFQEVTGNMSDIAALDVVIVAFGEADKSSRLFKNRTRWHNHAIKVAAREIVAG